MESLLDAIEPTDEYLREIGRIAVSWSRLESLMLHTLIMAVIGDFSNDGKALATLVHMSIPQMRQALEAVLRIVSEDIAKEYRIVDGLIAQAQTKRNEALHQVWHWEPNGVKRLSIKARGKLDITLVPVKLTDLMDAAPFINDVHDRLWVDVCVPLVAKNNPQQGQ